MMKKIFLFIILLTSLTFGQSGLPFLFDDDGLPQPFSSDALFVLDGTIIDIGGTKYFDDKSPNGRNFLITNYDFNSDWTTGFPYKSASTISAPAGDLALITADINHYLYAAADSTPNQIPVVSLFQDVDYGHKLFTRHGSQVLDANLVETYEPRVLDVVLYNTIKSGDGLTTCQTYYGVPTENLSAKWIDPVNGVDATGTGTKALPYKTFSKAISVTSSGGTIYIKTGALNEVCTIINKGITVIGTGFTKNNKSGDVAFFIQTNGATDNLIQGVICEAPPTIGVQINNSGTSNTYLRKMKITSGSIVYRTAYVVGATHTLTNCVTKGVIGGTVDELILTSNFIRKPTSGVSVLPSYNLTSSHNKYEGSTTTIIRRQTGTTAISLYDDELTGNIFTDEAIATVINITVDRCRMTGVTTGSGSVISLVNVANKASFTITNNTITQTYTSASILFSLKSYDIVFTDNIVNDHYGQVINATALAVSKTFGCERNILTSAYGQSVYSTDFTFTADSNIMISDVFSTFKATSVIYSGIPATISNNYIVSKTGTDPFVLIGTEYSTAIDSNLDGSKVYNNRFSGPADWGNDPSGMHATLIWSQSVEFYNNYFSGTFLGFVLKSNGGTYSGSIHHNIIKDCGMSFTIKGIKGTSIYNNTCYDAIGYDGLAETNPGTTGTSGNSTVKNNIYYDITNDSQLIYFHSTDDSVGCILDNNVYYNAAFTKIGAIGGSIYTLAEWQALGYDANSLDTNPNFTSATQLWCTTPFDGEDLGATYDDGLDITTTWGSSTTVPHVVTKQQTGTWQVGAFVQ